MKKIILFLVCFSLTIIIDAQVVIKPPTQKATPKQSKPSTKPQSKSQPKSQPKQAAPSRINTAPISNQMFTVNGVSFTMIGVQGGTFKMGGTSEQVNPMTNETPAHQVSLSSYMIGETEVTQALWKAVMGSNPSHYKGAKNPVEQVSWTDCHTFIEKLNAATGRHFRLPTEAEWEYAARGGKQSKGYQYSGSDLVSDVAWCSKKKSHAVGSMQPNELGIYDMSGNVYEWCEDRYGEYNGSDQTNPKGPSSGPNRVNRGGCWGDLAGNCRSAFRNNYGPDYRNDYLGLRLALSE